MATFPHTEVAISEWYIGIVNYWIVSRCAASPAVLDQLDFTTHGRDNIRVELLGLVRNGVIVLDGGAALPEGTRVCVSPTPGPSMQPESVETELICEPGKLPYVRGGRPGIWTLTNAMIEQIFEEEELEKVMGQSNVPS